MKRLLEVAAIVQRAERVFHEPGFILLDDGLIVDVGSGPYKGDRSGLEVIEHKRGIAMPGLVNSHGHAAMTLLRGIGDDLPLMDWLNQRVFPAEDKLTGDAIYWGTLLACCEMIRSGTTCFTDMYMSMHDTARAVEESGIRGVLSWGMVGFDESNRQRGIANTTAFAKRWHNQADGRITVTLGPHAPYTCPPDYLRTIAALSADLELPIQIHLSETKIEVENSLQEWGCSPIVHAHQCGLFERPVLAAHCVHVDQRDIELMAERGVHVAHNPQSNLKLASGIAPIVKMVQAGITVGLGTDGAASNNNLDMFEELRLAATLHKGISGDATVIPARQAFRMATSDSARAIFLGEGHGTLEIGQKADITILDADSPHFTPTYDLMSNVVYAAGSDDVTDVYVNGKTVLQNRQLVTIDMERVLFECRRIEQTLRP